VTNDAEVRLSYFEEQRRQELRFTDRSVVSVGVLQELDDFLDPPGLFSANLAERISVQRRIASNLFSPQIRRDRRWRVLIVQGGLKNPLGQERIELHNEVFDSREEANAVALQRSRSLIHAEGQRAADPAQAPWNLRMSLASWLIFAGIGLLEVAGIAALLGNPNAPNQQGAWGLLMGPIMLAAGLTTGVVGRFGWLWLQRRRAVQARHLTGT